MNTRFDIKYIESLSADSLALDINLYLNMMCMKYFNVEVVNIHYTTDHTCFITCKYDNFD